MTVLQPQTDEVRTPSINHPTSIIQLSGVHGTCACIHSPILLWNWFVKFIAPNLKLPQPKVSLDPSPRTSTALVQTFGVKLAETCAVLHYITLHGSVFNGSFWVGPQGMQVSAISRCIGCCCRTLMMPCPSRWPCLQTTYDWDWEGAHSGHAFHE